MRAIADSCCVRLREETGVVRGRILSISIDRSVSVCCWKGETLIDQCALFRVCSYAELKGRGTRREHGKMGWD